MSPNAVKFNWHTSAAMFASAPGKHSNMMVNIRAQFDKLLHKLRHIQHDVSSSPSTGVKGSELQIARRLRHANVNEFKLTSCFNVMSFCNIAAR
jgi:hypothetical protein